MVRVEIAKSAVAPYCGRAIPPIRFSASVPSSRQELNLPITVEELEGHSLVRLDGSCTLARAGELKKALLEGWASGRGLSLDLGRAEEIDVAVMQLLWAAGREAERGRSRIPVQMSAACGVAMREAGFDGLPGLAIDGDGWPK
jgi:hypothetical protein